MTILEEIEQTFGRDGAFAGAFPGYEPRRGQIDMALAIARAVMRDRNVALEAPTGTGKSIGYLVPLLMDLRDNPREIVVTKKHRGDEDGGYDEEVEEEVPRRIVVATANTALQDQLVHKDLPLLARLLPWKFTYQLLKGRSNYLCLDQLQTAQHEGLAVNSSDDAVRIIEDWAKQTKTGDKNEITAAVERVWGHYSVGGDECHGKSCDFYESCWHNAAKANAEDANVIVTNHSMLALHLRLHEMTGKHILLPRFSTLVLDEAHELGRYARSAWGFRLSQGAITRAIAPWRRLLEGLDGRDLHGEIQEAAEQFSVRIARFAGEPRFDHKVAQPELLRVRDLLHAAIGAIMQALQERKDARLMNREEEQAFRKGRRRVAGVLGRIGSIVGVAAAPDETDVEEAAAEDLVYWVERERDRPPALLAEPMEVGPQLQRVLFSKIPTAVVTSATLTVGGDEDTRWRYVENEIGLARHDRLILPSPFDLSRQLRVCVPTLPMPDERDAWEQKVPATIEHTILQARGRALVLFTSNRMMDTVYEYLTTGGRVPYRIMKQREAPTRVLLEEFKRDVNSVLLGVASLWTGIDVPGEALSCLLIDRLPFTHKNDPRVTAYRDRHGEGRCFDEMLLPDAILRFRQGIGRLIRTSSDRGVVVVLDGRVTARRYGSRFLSFGAAVQPVRADGIGQFLDGGQHGQDRGVPQLQSSREAREVAQGSDPEGVIVRRAMVPAVHHRR